MIATTSTGSINFPLTHSEHFFVDVALYEEFGTCVDSQEAFGYFRWNFTVSDGNFVLSDLVTTTLPVDCLSYAL